MRWKSSVNQSLKMFFSLMTFISEKRGDLRPRDASFGKHFLYRLMHVRSFFVEAKAEKGVKGAVRVMAHRRIACRSIARLEVPSEDQWISASKRPDWAPHPAARRSVVSRKNRSVNWIPETRAGHAGLKNTSPSSIWSINFVSARDTTQQPPQRDPGRMLVSWPNRIGVDWQKLIIVSMQNQSALKYAYTLCRLWEFYV